MSWCDAVYVGETGRSLNTRKKEHVKAVKEMNLQKSALCQHIATCDHFIAWVMSRLHIENWTSL